MNIHWSAPCLKYGLGVVFGLGLIGIVPLPGMAQITPDETLGDERSQINRNVQVRGGNADRIEGGATRGANLFHSFEEFNVNEGQRVYFANPAGIANILSRVTGRDVSDIMGTLGVEGGANLFLLNPNGIIFGPNARLDISGSFFSSTANGFTFPDGTEFSATNPGDSSLLSVSVPLGVQYGPNAPGAISNAGTLSVGQNFRLSGGSVTSTGQLFAPSGQLWVEGVAGDVQVRNAGAQTATFSASNNLFLQDSQIQTAGDLNLFAGNTVQVRDSVANPFIAYAGGNLTVQGNQNIDIFALNHPSSGLVSGGDMVLRSANTVGGDAHYWSGGNFRIEQLDGDLGNLYSLYDPVIRTNRSVRFDSYTGDSLHIHAGGSVTIDGSVTIEDRDQANGLPRESFEVSDPTGTAPTDERQITIDGQNEATLDIRSGYTNVPDSPQPPFLNIPGVVDSNNDYQDNTPGTDIRIGSIVNNRPRGRIYLQSAGSVVFTNTDGIPANGSNYSIAAIGNPVTISAQGDVRIPQGITTGSMQGTERADITIFSGGSIDTTANNTTSGGLTTFVNQGNSSDILLRAVEDITTGELSSRVIKVSDDTGTGLSGSITVISRDGQVRTGAIRSSTPNTGSTEFNGDINITADGDIRTGDILSYVGMLSVETQNLLGDREVSLTGAPGNAGDITLVAGGAIDTDRIASFAGGSDNSPGTGGRISLTANGGNITTNPGIQSFVGRFVATQGLLIDNRDVSTGEPGTAGSIRLNAPNGSINTGIIASFTGGTGNAGDINLRAGNGVEIFSARSFVGNYDANADRGDRETAGNGIAGEISIRSRTGDIRLDPNGSLLAFYNSPSFDDFSMITLIARHGSVILDRATLSATNEGDGYAGDIIITGEDQVVIKNITSISSEGYFGRIFIGSSPNRVDNIAPENVIIDNSRVTSNTATETVELDENGQRVNNVAEINIDATDNIRIRYGSRVTAATTSTSRNPRANDGGDINITTDSFTLTGSILLNSTFGEGNAGDITIQANEILLDNGAIIFNNTESSVEFNVINAILLLDERRRTRGARGDAGDITIGGKVDEDSNIITRQADSLTLTDGAQIQSLVRGVGRSYDDREAGRGRGGNIDIEANEVSLSGTGTNSIGNVFPSLISVGVGERASGRGGNIRIATDLLHLADGAILDASTPRGRGGNIRIQALNPEQESFLVLMQGGSQISARATGDAVGGNIFINDDTRYGNNNDVRTGNTLQRTGFVVANQDNNDIVANAIGNRGGNIRINAYAIFGLEERDLNPFSSDINASSESGVEGTVTLNTLNIDPTRGLGELPIDIIDAADLVAEGCVGSNRRGDETQGEFIRSGRGGLSPDPTGTLTDDSLIDPSTPADAPDPASAVPSDPAETASQPIIEAQGLARNASGKVELVPSSANSPVTSPGFAPNTCDAP